MLDLLPALSVSLLAVLGFVLAFQRVSVTSVAKATTDSAVDGISSMLDPALSDRQKEKALQKAGLSLLLGAWKLLWRFAVILGVALVPIVAFDMFDLVPQADVFSLMLSWEFIVGATVLVIVVAALVQRLRPRKASDVALDADVNQYSAVDRFFHVLAFSGPGVLKFASRLEDRFYPAKAAPTPPAPIFITSIARGGTTALLNAFHAMPGIATHTYRDMPFLTAPQLWNKLSGGDKRAVTRRKRAHGDGLEIDLDSPEAFEEVVWKMFWPEKFSSKSIAPWSDADARPEADAFLADHFAKIERARAAGGHSSPDIAMRYCSKNNANISRLGYLRRAFPEARIVIVLRRPECHAASLLRQHQNFSALQAEDDFTRRYMRDIGHFEFGLIHKPIAFAGFELDAFDPATPDYWLNYWIQAFREVERHTDACLIVTQDSLRQAPHETMQTVCERVGADGGGVDFRDFFLAKPDVSATDIYDPVLLAEATRLYDALAAKGVFAAV